ERRERRVTKRQIRSQTRKETRKARQKTPRLACDAAVKDCLDVIAVGVEYEGAVIVGVVLGAQPGGAVVARSGRQGRLVKSLYLLHALRAESHVYARRGGFALGQPEVATRVAAVVRVARAKTGGARVFFANGVAQRGQGGQVELPAGFEVRNGDADVVDHAGLLVEWRNRAASSVPAHDAAARGQAALPLLHAGGDQDRAQDRKSVV